MKTTPLANPRIRLTAVAFNELAAAAVDELLDNSDTFETHDLRVWMQKLKTKVNNVAEYRSDELEAGDAEPLGDSE